VRFQLTIHGIAMRLASLLWWGAEVREDARELHEKRDQVLAFLENELDNPATASKVVSSSSLFRLLVCMICIRTSVHTIIVQVPAAPRAARAYRAPRQ
jgi:hypothetical protein